MTQADDDGHIVDSRGHDFGLRVTVDATGRLFDSRGNALPRPEDYDSRGHLLPKEPESSGSAVRGTASNTMVIVWHPLICVVGMMSFSGLDRGCRRRRWRNLSSRRDTVLRSP